MMNKWILNTLLCCAMFSTSVLAEDLQNCEVDFSLKKAGMESMSNSLFLANCNLTNETVNALKDYSLQHPNENFLFFVKVSANKDVRISLMKMLVENPFIEKVSLVFSPDFSSEFDRLTNKSNLKELNLGGNALTKKSFFKLSKNQSIKALGINEKNINGKDLVKFTENHPLKTLSIGRMQFNKTETLKLSAQNPKLKTLSLAEVKFEDMAFLEKFSQLKNLTIYQGTTLTKEVLQNIAHHPKLKGLEVIHNDLTDTALEIISNNSRLESITLNYNKIGDRGAQALSQITHLKSISLMYNKISDNGAIALSELPEINFLDLGYNQITDAGGIALSNKTNLQQLILSSNQLGDATAYAFANQKTEMLVLDMWGNHFSNDARCALWNNKHIHYLSVEFCDDEYKRNAHPLLKTKTAEKQFMDYFIKEEKR